MARKPRTILEVCVARGGALRGARVQAFIAQWTIASHALGKPLTLDEYAAWWREPERTAFRHQAQFREVFPELETPQPIADVAMRDAAAMRRGVAGVGALRAAGLVPA